MALATCTVDVSLLVYARFKLNCILAPGPIIAKFFGLIMHTAVCKGTIEINRKGCSHTLTGAVEIVPIVALYSY